MSSQSKPSQGSPLQTVSQGPSNEPQVRYISRPVRAAQTPDPLGDFLRLTGLIASILVIVLLLVSMIGLIGIRLGFEPLFGLPTRSMQWSDFMVFGFEIARTLPGLVALVGEQQILLPVLGFMLIGTPAALLVIARPRVPGGPALRPQAQGLAVAGSIFSALFYLGAILWLAGPWRTEVLDGVSLVSSGYESWFESFVILCGVDAFLLCALVPWFIFAYRLPLFRELQFTTRSIALAGSTFILFGASISLGLHNGLVKPFLTAGPDTVLVGTVGDDLLVVELEQNPLQSTCLVVDADTRQFDGMHSINDMMLKASR